MTATLDMERTRTRAAAAPPPAALLDLVVERVRLRARRRLAWLAHLDGDDRAGAAGASAAAAAHAGDEPAGEGRWYERSAAVAALNRELARVEEALAREPGEPLARLESLFGIPRPESELLQTCLAAAVEPALAPLYAALQGHPSRGYPTEALAARLFGHGRRPLWSPSGPLAAWGWVTAGEAPAGEPAPLICDPLARDWLESGPGLDGELLGLLREVEPRDPLPGWPVEALADRVREAMERGFGARILLAGAPGSGRRTLAAAIAARLGLPALAVDTGRIDDEDWTQTFVRIQRQMVLWQAAAVWHGSRLDRPWPTRVPAAPIQLVAADEEQAVPPHEPLIDHRFELPVPTLEERRLLWSKLVPQSASWAAPEVTELVARHRLTVGHIAALGRRAPSGPGEASRVCRELTRQGLGELGQLLECPFTWDDLVVPERLRGELEDFAFEARQRAPFWESPPARRLFPRGRGLVGLLSGPPGTGKTMAAQVIAADLELDLFRIDLASAVSKYIGETAKNLRRIFRRAERMDAILLFDEADALFGKRTEVRDAHDRYANADTNYLLQLLEDFQGIALLASNKKGNIDPAFTRRLRYAFHFPRPRAPLRLEIWRRVVGELTDEPTLRRLASDLEALASEIELPGAQIKSAVLAALFVARRKGAAPRMEHLLRGVNRELGKEGRAVSVEQRRGLDRLSREIEERSRDA